MHEGSGERPTRAQEMDPAEARSLLDARFRLFVESVTDYAILMLDTDGRVVSWNPGAERIKGYAAEEILGRHFSLFYTEEDRISGRPWQALAIARADGHHAEEGWRVRKDGSRFWASAVLTAVRDDEGRLVGFGKVTRDLTERKRQEERERELLLERAARAEAEAANRGKSEFLATMSHELRTPLTAIIGYTELMAAGLHGPLTAQQSDSLERIRRSSQLLASLINNLLDFARLETGHLGFEVQDIPLAPVLAGVESLVLPEFEKAGVTLSREGCDRDLVLRADPDRLEQILLNLLTNAQKFTAPGGRTWIRCEADEAEARVLVSDTGRGIPPDRREAIFEPFVQLERERMRTGQPGVGLGLAISRDFARAMGGDITVESEVGRGSTFTLRLPRSVPGGAGQPAADRRGAAALRQVVDGGP
ncbi:MAG: PAS domain S-box protein [Gemmatimonadetes bacterium]|nr:PAS domain S-box protein [Gemmatimonadota bacterium]